MRISEHDYRSENITWEIVVARLLARQEEMYAAANAACEQIWAENVKRRRGPVNERLHYLPVVEKRAVGISVYWVKIESKWSHHSKRHMPRYRKLGRGKTYRMPMAKFRGASEFEQRLISEVEEKVERYRAETQWAANLKMQLNAHPYRRRRERAEREQNAAATPPPSEYGLEFDEAELVG